MERLTITERSVLKAVAKGWTNEQVAAHLDRSEQTVKNHLSSIFLKLHVANRVEAAVMLVKEEIGERDVP